MRSKASIKSHPLHPILVAFPIAFFTGAVVFDVLSIVYKSTLFSGVATYINIAGIVGALVAAIPGAIDYFMTVPPKSSAKQRAAFHGILNVTNVVIFFIAWQLRGSTSEMTIVVIEAIGLVIMLIAGWLGGTLVYRNQIAVDPRYANAGKWKEEYLGNDEVEVATVDELQVNQMKLVHRRGKRIVIARTENGYVAFDDRCTHKGGSLAGGAMICGTVQCPWHGSHFDVCDGKVKSGPAKMPIAIFPLLQEREKIILADANPK